MTQEAKVKGVVDIVFLLDTTGSMQPCIDGLKLNIGSFISTLTGKDANNESPVRDWRIKIAGYADAEHTPDSWFTSNPFTNDPTAVKSHLAALQAKGGGEAAETLLDALFVLASAEQTEAQEEPSPEKWRYRRSAARVIIAFTDAPYKPVMFIPEAKGGTVDDVIQICQQQRIILCLFCPENDGYHKLSELDKSEVEFIGPDDDQATAALTAYTSDQANFKRALEALAKSVSKSCEVPAL